MPAPVAPAAGTALRTECERDARGSHCCEAAASALAGVRARGRRWSEAGGPLVEQASRQRLACLQSKHCDKDSAAMHAFERLLVKVPE